MIGSALGAGGGLGTGMPSAFASNSGAASSGPAVDGQLATDSGSASASDAAGDLSGNAPTSADAKPGAAAQRDQAGRRADAADRSDFASLLAGGEPGASAPAVLPPAALPIADDSRATTSTPASPDQLLALLAGSLAIPAVPQAVDAAAVASQTASSSVLPGAGTMAQTPIPLASVSDGMPMPASGKAAADANAIDSAVRLSASAITEAMGSASAASGGDSAPSFDNLIALPAIAPVASASSHTALPIAAATPLAVPADPDAGFDDGFGARIAWMAEQRLGHAEIRLNPENLGPIEVRVQMDGNRVNAEFHSSHVEVRQAIEASVPRLREMLSQQGLQLGHADVGQRGAGRDQSTAGGPGNRSDAGPLGETPAASRVRSRGLVDEYA